MITQQITRHGLANMRRASAAALSAALAFAMAVALPPTAHAEEPMDGTQSSGTTRKAVRQTPQSDVVVAAFQQSWNTVAAECANIYGPSGIGYVQISPPSESVQGVNWDTAYQPVSYKLDSRYGTQQELQTMIAACNAQGVAVIADVELNHTTSTDSSWIDDQAGVSDSGYNGTYGRYPEFGGAEVGGKGLYRYQENGNNHQYGLTTKDFHDCSAKIVDFTDTTQVWECRRQTYWDLNTGSEHVQEVQADYLARLWNLGVRGFRISSAKYMSPRDIAAVKAKLSEKIGVEAKDIPYAQEVVYHLNESEDIQPERYVDNGKVTEFRYSTDVFAAFQGSVSQLRKLANVKLSSNDAVVAVANWDTVRGSETLTQKSGARYELANAFMLANDYGTPVIVSDYYFDDATADLAPQGTTDKRVPDIDMKTKCAATTNASAQWAWGSWYCQPYWTSTRGLVGFHNAVDGTAVQAWQEPSANVIGFARRTESGQDKGFFALNNTLNKTKATYYSTLPDGVYCNVYATAARNCAESKRVTVKDGAFTVTIPARSAVAIHVDAKYDPDDQSAADEFTTGYVDQADLGRIADDTLTTYFHNAENWTDVTAEYTDASGATHDVPMTTVDGHEGWLVAQVKDFNADTTDVRIVGGAQSTDAFSAPVGATLTWIDDTGLHQGTPFASSDAVSTSFTVHLSRDIAEASGIVIMRAGEPDTYVPFPAEGDTFGKRLETTVQGVVDAVTFRVAKDADSSDAAVPGTQNSYTATALSTTTSDFTERISGSVEAWVDAKGTLSMQSPEKANPSAIPQPNDQKNPQELDFIVHYFRGDGNYQEYDRTLDSWRGWDLWTWVKEGASGGMQQFTSHDDWGEVATFKFLESQKGIREPSFIVRQGGDAWLAKDPDGDRHILESAIHVAGNQSEHGTVEIWLVEGDPTIYTYRPAVTGVVFDTHGGSEVPAQTIAVAAKATEPAAPTRDGYVFSKWTTDAAGEMAYDFTKPVDGPLTLHAQWTESFDVDFDLQGGDSADGSATIPSVAVPKGGTLTITQQPVKEGYTFDGWATTAGGEAKVHVGDELTVQRATTLYAVWTAKQYDVTFDANGGAYTDASESSRTVRVAYGDTVAVPAEEARPANGDKQFVGWTVTQNGREPYDFTLPVHGALTLYAKWADKDASVATVTLHHHNGPDGADVAGTMYTVVGESIELPESRRDGHRFAGWSQQETGEPVARPYEVTNADVQLHAQWVKVHQVTFDADGGSDVPGQTVDDGEGVDLTKAASAKDGFVLDHWSKPDGERYDDGVPITEDTELKAVWRKAGTRWVVRFNLNGGTVKPEYADQVEDQFVYDGEFAVRPAFPDTIGEDAASIIENKPQREGYRFQGWSTVKNDIFGLSVFQFETQPIDRNCTLYALWERM